MCEADAYLAKEREEELVLKSIMIFRPEDGQIYLQNIFGEQKRTKARIKEMNPGRSPDHLGGDLAVIQAVARNRA
jgi:predicted RNA-binding protein